jgi:hypothetical protein
MNIIEQIKKLAPTLALTVAMAALAISGIAATVIGPSPGSVPPLINSTSTTQTNCTFGTTTNGIWPNAIPPGVTVTNITPIQGEQAFKDLAFQWSSQNGAAFIPGGTNSVVTITFARNLSGGTPTNAIGTGLLLEFVNWTPTFQTNTLQNYASCTNFSSANNLKGAIPNWFVYSITAPGTNGTANAGSYLTNYFLFTSSL